MADRLTEVELDQLIRCEGGENIASSFREGDRARMRLKKRGYLVFDREFWVWRITDLGRAALSGDSK